MRVLLCLSVLALPASSQPALPETCPIQVLANLHGANQSLELAVAQAAMLSDQLNKLILSGERISAESGSPSAATWPQDADRVREMADETRRSILMAQKAHPARP